MNLTDVQAGIASLSGEPICLTLGAGCIAGGWILFGSKLFVEPQEVLRRSYHDRRTKQLMPQPDDSCIAKIVTAVAATGLVDAARDAAEEYGLFGMPLVTTAVVAAQALAFHFPRPAQSVDLGYSEVLEGGEGYRVFTSAWTHIDAPHLLGNMVGTVRDLVYLEKKEGSWGLAAEVLGMTVLTGGTQVLLAELGSRLIGKGFWYFRGGVGFSGVAFALKVIADHSRDNGAEKHSWGKLLFSSQLAAPNVSFLAHLYGVLAGHVRVHLLPPGYLSVLCIGIGGTCACVPAARDATCSAVKAAGEGLFWLTGGDKKDDRRGHHMRTATLPSRRLLRGLLRCCVVAAFAVGVKLVAGAVGCQRKVDRAGKRASSAQKQQQGSGNVRKQQPQRNL